MQQNNTPKTIHVAIPAEIYAVKFTDGYGETDMRFVAIVHDEPYLLDATVSKKARLAQSWFKKQLMNMLGKAKKTPKKTAKPEQTKESSPKPINVDGI